MSAHPVMRLPALLDGELAPAEAAEVNAHLDACDGCRREAERMQGLDLLLAPREELPLGLRTRLREIPTQHRAPVAVRFRWAAAAVVLMAVGAALLWNRGQPAVDSPTRDVASTPDVPAPISAQERMERALVAGTVEADAYLDELGETILEPLYVASASKDDAVARAALRRLGALGVRDALPVLRRSLDREALRRTAIASLGVLGDPRAVPALRPFLADRATATLAIQSLVRIGEERAAQALADHAAREPGAVVIDALGAVGGEPAARALANMAASGGRFAARARLVAQESEAVLVPALLDVADGRDEHDASRALALLERLAPEDAVRRLAVMLERSTQRVGAARVLARIDSADAVAAVLRAGHAEDLDVVFDGAGPGAEAQLIEELDARDWRRRTRAIELLGRCGGARAVARLAELRGDRALAPHAVEALGRIGGADAVRTLAELGTERRLAAEVVAALGATGRAEAVPEILALAKRSRRLHRAALDALTHIPLPEAVTAIVTLDGGRHLRAPTNHALRQMDATLVKRALIAMLDTENAAGARHALSKLTRRGSRGAP